METHILVVDDEPEIAALVEVYLQSEGFTVHICGTGTGPGAAAAGGFGHPGCNAPRHLRLHPLR